MNAKIKAFLLVVSIDCGISSKIMQT